MRPMLYVSGTTSSANSALAAYDDNLNIDDDVIRCQRLIKIERDVRFVLLYSGNGSKWDAPKWLIGEG